MANLVGRGETVGLEVDGLDDNTILVGEKVTCEPAMIVVGKGVSLKISGDLVGCLKGGPSNGLYVGGVGVLVGIVVGRVGRDDGELVGFVGLIVGATVGLDGA